MALPQAIDILNYLHLIFLHVREFHRTLSEVVSSLTADHSFIQSPQERHLEEHSATQPLLSILRIVPHLVYATQTYIRQNHVILNIAQIQHHPTFIGISCSLYISFIQANTQFVSASTMYAMQSNANSCMPSAPLARSGSPPRCCKHLPSIHIIMLCYRYIISIIIHSYTVLQLTLPRVSSHYYCLFSTHSDTIIYPLGS